TTVSQPGLFLAVHAKPSRGAKLNQVVFHSGVPRGANDNVLGLLTSPNSVYASLPFASWGGGLTSHRRPRERLSFGATCHSSWAKSAVSLKTGVALKTSSTATRRA